jgi:MinD-like ATPase involved in chromosome partitioning or flagellar assembly
VNIFKRGGGREIAEELDVPFLGGIPIDPEICVDSDDGKPFIMRHPESPASKAFMDIVKKIERYLEGRRASTTQLKLVASKGDEKRARKNY